MPYIPPPYTQYGGIWKLNAASAAKGAGTWPTPPEPHLFAWGYNAQGELGLGNTTGYSSPKQVGNLTNWALLPDPSTSTSESSFAIKSDGTLWAWGYNAYGDLGLGNRTYYSSPKQVGSLTNWSFISSGLAVKTDGTLWSWGYNSFGQLGLGNRTYYSSPKQVGSLTNWYKAWKTGSGSSFSIKTDGTLWSWGKNQYGELGLGNRTYYSSPKQVGSLTNWSYVAAGNWYVVAAKTDGTLWAWGTNDQGQLGLNNRTNYSSPVQVGSLTSWSVGSCGGSHTIFTKTDSTLWSWGGNGQGQLGLGNRTYYSSPKQVGSLTNWSSVTCGSVHSISIKTDGTLWGWGFNTYGNLGLGNQIRYSSPKQVGSLTSWLKVSALYGGALAIAKT